MASLQQIIIVTFEYIALYSFIVTLLRNQLTSISRVHCNEFDKGNHTFQIFEI